MSSLVKNLGCHVSLLTEDDLRWIMDLHTFAICPQKKGVSPADPKANRWKHQKISKMCVFFGFLVHFVGKRFNQRPVFRVFCKAISGIQSFFRFSWKKSSGIANRWCFPPKNKHPKQRNSTEEGYKPGPQRHHPVAFQ